VFDEVVAIDEAKFVLDEGEVVLEEVTFEKAEDGLAKAMFDEAEVALAEAMFDEAVFDEAEVALADAMFVLAEDGVLLEKADVVLNE
jgi:hypothetical protein